MRGTGASRATWNDVALRAFRSPLSGLAALLASTAAELDAPLAAIHLVPGPDGPVELLTSGGPEAGVLGPPGRAGSNVDRAVRAATSTAMGGEPTGSIKEIPPWDGYAHVGSLSIPLEGNEAALVSIATNDRPAGPELTASLGPMGLLVQMVLHKRVIDRLKQELHRTNEDHAIRVAGLHHDLRGPLTSIVGASRTLSVRGDELNERLRNELLDSIAGQAERMARMIEATMGAGSSDDQITVRRMRVDLRAVIERAASTVTVMRPGKISIESAGEDAVTDPDRLERVLLNLLDNALKYSPRDVPVHVIVDSDLRHVSITVADNGSGVSPDVLPGLFTAYATDPDRTDGTGLGLHSARALVEELGGRIGYARASGWTRFTVSLPVDRTRDDV